VSTETDLSQTIADAAAAPKRMRNDAGEAEAHSLADLIKADEHLARKAVSRNPLSMVRTSRVQFGGDP
jgi:hypothetical protein